MMWTPVNLGATMTWLLDLCYHRVARSRRDPEGARRRRPRHPLSAYNDGINHLHA